jgi:hypothetical protein
MLENAPAKVAAPKPGAGKATATEKAGVKPAARKSAGQAGALKPATRKATAANDLQTQIQQRAYELWERDGRPEGRDFAHWQQAEREIGAARPSN